MEFVESLYPPATSHRRTNGCGNELVDHVTESHTLRCEGKAGVRVRAELVLFERADLRAV